MICSPALSPDSPLAPVGQCRDASARIVAQRGSSPSNWRAVHPLLPSPRTEWCDDKQHLPRRRRVEACEQCRGFRGLVAKKSANTGPRNVRPVCGIERQSAHTVRIGDNFHPRERVARRAAILAPISGYSSVPMAACLCSRSTSTGVTLDVLGRLGEVEHDGVIARAPSSASLLIEVRSSSQFIVLSMCKPSTTTAGRGTTWEADRYTRCATGSRTAVVRLRAREWDGVVGRGRQARALRNRNSHGRSSVASNARRRTVCPPELAYRTTTGSLQRSGR
jgi:hypothetical protein